MKINVSIYESVQAIDVFTPKAKFFAMRILKDLGWAYLAQKKENENDHGFIHKHRDYFRSVTGMKDAKPFVEYMQERGLLEINNSYSISKYTQSYRPAVIPDGKWITINDGEYLNAKELYNYKGRMKKMENIEILWHKYNLENVLILDLEKVKTLYLERLSIELKSENHKDMLAEVMDIEPAGMNIADTFLVGKTIELLDLADTEIKQGEKGKRHYHALSNAPKDLRACLMSKNKRKPYLIELDIKSSQPTILYGLMKQRGYMVESLIGLAIFTGKFYEVIGELWGYEKEAVTKDRVIRGEVKEKVFKYILFANSYDTKEFKVIEGVCPIFCGYVRELSKEQSLASLLQTTESEIMLPIVKKYGGIGIHDSVIIASVSSDKEAEKIILDITKRFTKLKVVPHIEKNIISVLEKKG